MLIVFEGVDGSGKTTVSRAIAQRLGEEWMCFPDRTTPIGKLIDGYLKGEWRAGGWSPSERHTALSAWDHGALNALIFQGLQFANRLEHLDRLRQSAHKPLVLDRYWASAVAYGGLDGLDKDWLIKTSQQLPQATLNILLDVPPAVSAARVKARGGPKEHYDRQDVLAKLRATYQEVWGWGRQAHGEKHWQVVDATGTQEEVIERAWDIVKRPIAL